MTLDLMKLTRNITLGLGALVVLGTFALGIATNTGPFSAARDIPLLIAGLALAYGGHRTVLSDRRPVSLLLRALRRRGTSEATVISQGLDERTTENATVVGRWTMTLEYTVDGRAVTTPWYPYDAWTNSQRTLDRVERRYPIGHKTVVHFDPQGPSNLRVRNRIGPGEALAALLEPIVLAIYLAGLFLSSLVLSGVFHG